MLKKKISPVAVPRTRLATAQMALTEAMSQIIDLQRIWTNFSGYRSALIRVGVRDRFKKINLRICSGHIESVIILTAHWRRIQVHPRSALMTQDEPSWVSKVQTLTAIEVG